MTTCEMLRRSRRIHPRTMTACCNRHLVEKLNQLLAWIPEDRMWKLLAKLEREADKIRDKADQATHLEKLADTYSEVSNLDNTNSPATRMDAGCAVVQIADF